MSDNFENILSFLMYVFGILGQIAFLSIPLLISMAYLVYAERRIIGFMQMRLGPNLVGPFGLLQPFANALKLLLKEVIIPYKSNQKLFLFAPK